MDFKKIQADLIDAYRIHFGDCRHHLHFMQLELDWLREMWTWLSGFNETDVPHSKSNETAGCALVGGVLNGATF